VILILVVSVLMFFYASISAGSMNTGINVNPGEASEPGFIFTDVSMDAGYYEDVARLWALGIVNGDGQGQFRPDDMLTREQFAILMVRASGLEEKANLLKGSIGFPDVPAGRYSSGYVNVAVSQGYIAGMPDGKFNPGQNITYAQVLTVLVRALGYRNEELAGMWPGNYIEKAKSIGLVQGLEYGNNDAIPRWVAIKLINRLLDAKMKESSSAQQAKTFGEYYGVCTNPESIILGNQNTHKSIGENQVLTDRGIFHANADTIKYTGRELEQGRKYNLTMVDDEIVWASDPLNEIKRITVISAVENKVSYYLEDKSIEEVYLSEQTTYYYNGSKQNFGAIKGMLRQNSSIVFAYDNDKNGYEYAAVFDPIYSSPEVKRDYESRSSSISIGSITIDSASIPVIKGGEAISIRGIKYGDVVYEVTDIWGNYKYIFVNEAKVFGRITGIIPNIIAASGLELDRIAYDLSSSFNKSKISGGKGSFAVGDSVAALLGINGEIVDILHPDELAASEHAFLLNYDILIPASGSLKNAAYNVRLFLEDGSRVTCKTDTDPSGMKGKFVKYARIDSQNVSLELPDSIDENVKKNFASIEGFYSECIILGNSHTFDYLSENQVLTDAGILYNVSNEPELELGNKYRAVIDGDCILLVDGKMKLLENITIKSAVDNRISGIMQGMAVNMVLPQKTVYYYNGVKQDYNNLKNILTANSSIIFAYNSDKTGYDYGVIFDPLYSKPVINRSAYTITTNVGSIELAAGDIILKNNEVVDASKIYYGDVVYKITDIWGGNRYILVINKRERGIISAIKPNILSPQYIQLKNVTYEFDKDMDFSKIYGGENPVKVGNTVTLLLGRDGKVVDIL
jgi:hypothetical protein